MREPYQEVFDPMSDRETQLHEGTHAPLDNQDRNAVRPQTQEAYGDQELAAETKVTHERHYAGQPLETRADRDANEEVRAERYERAKVDPVFARQHKIDVDEDDQDTDAWENEGGVVGAPLVTDVPDEVDGEDGDDRPKRKRQAKTDKALKSEREDSE